MSAMSRTRTSLTPEQYEAQQNARSIQAIPLDQLPDGPAREHLIWLASNGQEVYAYRPVGQREYVIWHYDGNPAAECRYSPHEWAAKLDIPLTSDRVKEGEVA